MSLTNLFRARLIQKFIDANVEGAGRLAPRDGYYLVTEVAFRKIGLFGEVPIAKVGWKANENDWFYSDVQFEIALSSMYPKFADDYSAILGQQIEIYETKLINGEKNGSPVQVLNCQWALITPTDRITTLKSQILSTYFGKAKTLSEAYQNFEKKLGVDLSYSLDEEAVVGYVEDIELDEPYDAPDLD